MMPAQAIETRYAGCRFRSRLEARWAVFFETAGIAWQYEPQGFTITGPFAPTTGYLPDFYLPDVGVWVECKGSSSALRRDLPKLVNAVLPSGLPGDPDGTLMPDDQPYVRMLILRDPSALIIPDAAQRMPIVPALGCHAGTGQVYMVGVNLATQSAVKLRNCSETPIADWYQQAVNVDPALHGFDHRYPAPDSASAVRMCWAFNAAATSRFEHGESGPPPDAWGSVVDPGVS